MYNLINIYKKRRATQAFCCSILLTNKELESIMSSIHLAKDADGFYAPKNDSLTQKERRQIFNKFPSIPYINDVSYSICLSEPFKETFFTKKKLAEFLLCPLQPGCSPILGQSISPIDSRPTYLNHYYYIWHHEIGVVEKRSNKNRIIGFVHPVTNRLLFKDISQYLEYNKSQKKMKKRFNNRDVDEPQNEQYFVRVINVYDKVTNSLKYRILNDEFDRNSIGYYALAALEGDEDLYMRSYEIDKTNIKELKPYYNIDFDFESNRYFFETLNANTFTMPYKEFVNKLKSTRN